MPNNYCCVPQCKNSTRNCPDKTNWFSFPKDHKLRKVWIQKIKRDIGKNFQITRNTTICSNHFVAFDIFPKINENRRTYLKRTAIPSIFPWDKQPSDQDRDSQMATRNSIKISSQRPRNKPKHNASTAEKNETDETSSKEELQRQEIEDLRMENKQLHQEMEEMRREIASLKKSNTYLKGKFLEMQEQIVCYENVKIE